MQFISQYEEALALGVTGNRYCKTVRPVLFRGSVDMQCQWHWKLGPIRKSLAYTFAVMGETYCPQRNAPPLDRGGGCGDTACQKMANSLRMVRHPWWWQWWWWLHQSVHTDKCEHNTSGRTNFLKPKCQLGHHKFDSSEEVVMAAGEWLRMLVSDC